MNAGRSISPLPKPEDSLDADDLDLLSIFHFVGAGLAFLVVLLFIAHFALSHAVHGNTTFLHNQKEPPPELSQMLLLIKWMHVISGIWLVASAILNILSGIFLRRRKCRMFSLVVAGLNCLHIPLGTLLGVFTFLVLDRASVRDMYAAGNSPAD